MIEEGENELNQFYDNEQQNFDKIYNDKLVEAEKNVMNSKRDRSHGAQVKFNLDVQ